MEFLACQLMAEERGKLFFGLENPQNFVTKGHAACWLFDEYPALDLAANDAMCQVETLDGHNLGGGGGALALYGIPAGVCARPPPFTTTNARRCHRRSHART